ncbi:MAG TPA: hypothetical protein VKG22_00605 [Stellaceae bacterium]|nr:hypothetical protein [Stellaceae bacterium]
MTHLPPATVTRSAADLQNRLQALLSLIPLDLFAFLRSRSTGGQFLSDLRPLAV